MGLTYRMHAPADEPALIRLWCEHSGWDQVSAETWAERFLRPPFGPSSIAVAEDDATGEVVGQFVFIPVVLSVDGREVTGARPFAPIVSSTARAGVFSLNPLAHPIAAMYRCAADAFRARGDGVIYMVPDPRWRRLFRVLPFVQTGSFPLFSRPLPLEASLPLPDGYTAALLNAWDDRVDRLWARSRALDGVTLVRSAEVLAWKVGHGDYTVTAVEREGELVGLVASRQKGDRQWLLCDLLAADADALRAALVAACHVADRAAREAPPEHPIAKVALLATPRLRAACEPLGFRPDDYRFPLVVHVLDDGLGRAAVAPERWYLSAND